MYSHFASKENCTFLRPQHDSYLNRPKKGDIFFLAGQDNSQCAIFPAKFKNEFSLFPGNSSLATMSQSFQVILVILSFLTSFVLSGIITLVPDFLPDVPNTRSAHKKIIPRGGGIAFVFCFFTSMVLISLVTDVTYNKSITALTAGALIIALLGLLDDAFALPALPRLTLQGLFAIIICLYGVPERIRILGLVEVTGAAALAFQVMWIIACINFFNFMDGLDGLASNQGLFMAIVMGFLFLFDPFSNIAEQSQPGMHDPVLFKAMGLGYFCLASALAGFLLWNTPPARLFMGDTGSYFLGFVFGFCALITPYSTQADMRKHTLKWTGGEISSGPADFTIVFILLLPFLLDTSLTLIYRLRQGQNIFQAHKDHLYQLLYRSGWTAGKINLLFFGFNLLLLWPAFELLNSSRTGIILLFSIIILSTALHLFFSSRMRGRLEK